MDFLNFILHPRKTLRLRREANQLRTCIVHIDHPRQIIKGRRYISSENPQSPVTFIAFLGIPYARHPHRHLRFRPPQPLREDPYGNPKVIKAYSSDHPCLQCPRKFTIGNDPKDDPKNEPFGSENCLYLNVYVPKRPEQISKLLPVLVHIHGGEFERGSNDMEVIKPYYIIEQNVVFVTINYRLGVFGFLNMRTEECPGNAGLKDQVKALEWIQQNIEKFKGDPNNVTISGHEAGATCVNLHLISPLSTSKPLFHKAIVQAGGIHCPWGLQQEKQRKVEKLCHRTFSPKGNITKVTLVNLMKDSEAEMLLYDFERITRRFYQRDSKKLLVFMGPSEEFQAEGAFIPPGESIESLSKRAKPVPIIAGITRMEGYKYFYERLNWSEEKITEMVTNVKKFVQFLRENFSWSSAAAARKTDEILQMYFGGSTGLAESDFQQIQDNLATLLTDIWFHRFFENFEIGKKSAPLFVYRFDYFNRYREDAMEVRRDENEKIKTIRQTAPGHGDDMLYLYNPRAISVLQTSDGRRAETGDVTKRMCRLWGSFCYDGVPKYENFEWLSHTAQQPCYLSIDASLSMIREHLGGNRWRQMKGVLQSESPASSPEPFFSPILKLKGISQSALEYIDSTSPLSDDLPSGATCTSDDSTTPRL